MHGKPKEFPSKVYVSGINKTEIKRMQTTEISLPPYFIIPVFSSNDKNKMSKVVFQFQFIIDNTALQV